VDDKNYKSISNLRTKNNRSLASLNKFTQSLQDKIQLKQSFKSPYRQDQNQYKDLDDYKFSTSKIKNNEMQLRSKHFKQIESADQMSKTLNDKDHLKQT
jgi:hypothetical protein